MLVPNTFIRALYEQSLAQTGSKLMFARSLIHGYRPFYEQVHSYGYNRILHPEASFDHPAVPLRQTFARTFNSNL